MNAQTAVERFLAAYYSGDTDAARAAITEDFTLTGPFAAARSADEFFQLAKGLLQVVRGHEVRRWVVQGGTVSALYEILIQGPAGVRPLTTGGWFTVVGGRVSSGELIYDAEAFHTILAP
jgi:hypothetical protein